MTLIYSSYSKRHEWTELSSIQRSCSLKQPSAISSDRPSRQRIWRSTTKGQGHQTDESTKGQESSAEFPGNSQLFEALLSQVDETIQTTHTVASGRNGKDLDFPIKMPSMPSKTSSPWPQYSPTLTKKNNTLFRLTLSCTDSVPYCCEKENQWSTYPDLSLPPRNAIPTSRGNC